MAQQITTTTTSMPLHHAQHVMTALSLNNMAVDLLKKEEYGNALRALRASLSLMQLSANGSSEIPGICSEFDDEQHNNNNSVYTMATEMDVVQEDDVSSIRASIMFGPSARATFPILISQSSFQTNNDWLEACKNYGIILYNRGLASFILSCQEETQPLLNEFLQESYGSLQQAEAVFAAIDDVFRQMMSCSSKRPAAASTVPLLRVMVLNFLGLVCHSQDLHHQAEEAIRIGSLLLLQHAAGEDDDGR